MLVRENKVCTHAVEIWYVLLVAMVVVFFSGSVINFWPIGSRDFFFILDQSVQSFENTSGHFNVVVFHKQFSFKVKNKSQLCIIALMCFCWIEGAWSDFSECNLHFAGSIVAPEISIWNFRWIIKIVRIYKATLSAAVAFTLLCKLNYGNHN